MKKYNVDNQRRFNFELSSICAFFRRHVLKITLNELSKRSKVPVSTLSSFEMGRSSNLRYIYLYLVSCETDKQKNIFIDSIDKLLERNYYND